MRFNIAIFNPENKPIYIDQLKVLLQSIWDIYQDSVEISVYYTMMENKDIVEIKSKFPHIYTKESPIRYTYKNKNIPLAAQKNNLWYDLFVDCDTEKQVFIDADMVLLKKIDHFFDDSFDIGYTYKTEKDEVLWKPLNTGVILINNTEKAREFMTFWTEETNKMLDSDDLNVYIIHFKGSWRKILTEGDWEHSARTRAENDEALYKLWYQKFNKYNNS